MYSVSCYIDKVIVEKDNLKSITIKPTGRSRVENENDRCLGFDCESKNEKEHKVSWFPLVVSVDNELRDVILMARIHGKEVELKIAEFEGSLIVKSIVI